MAVRAWQAHDTGLVAVLPRFRRLPGRIRHHQGRGPAWPAVVLLAVEGDQLVVVDDAGAPVGRWPVSEVTAVRMSAGPPVAFTLDLGGAGAHLLNAAAGPDVAALLAALT